MSAVWIRHPETDAVNEVPESSVPFHLQAGWVPLTEQEVTDLHAKQLDQRREAELAMSNAARTAPEPRPDGEQPSSSPEPEQPEQPEQPEFEQPEQLPTPEREQPKPASARHKSGSSKESN